MGEGRPGAWKLSAALEIPVGRGQTALRFLSASSAGFARLIFRLGPEYFSNFSRKAQKSNKDALF
jgi:hypothetical protein